MIKQDREKNDDSQFTREVAKERDGERTIAISNKKRQGEKKMTEKNQEKENYTKGTTREKNREK